MIVSNRKYPFGTIITRMKAGEREFIVSTAKEGLFKGLTTSFQLPEGNMAAKLFYMPSINKEGVHLLHEVVIRTIEEGLKTDQPLVSIIMVCMQILEEDKYTLESVLSTCLKESVLDSMRDNKIQTICPSCKATLRVIPRKQNRCPGCRTIFVGMDF